MARFASYRLPGMADGTFRRWADVSFYRPAYLPPMTDMRLAKDGTIWLRGQPEGGQVSWLVLDRDGEPMARASLPEGLTALVIDACTVWGSELDELDVPYLVRYRVACGR